MPHKVTGRRFRRIPYVPLAVALAAGLVLLMLAMSPVRSEAGRGRWSPPQAWSEKAVHMALLPGDGSPYLGHILWWKDEDATEWLGGQWGWKADNDAVDCSSYPEVKFDSLGLSDPGSNIIQAGAFRDRKKMVLLGN